MSAKKPRTPCFMCSKEPYRSFYIYCSNACQRQFQYKDYIRRWKLGEVSGLSSMGIVTNQVKRYLREKYGNKCCVCGWSKINPSTNKAPLVADHIDGNWRNNHESNLRLLCPNCDSLTSTFSALNKGNGRPNRQASKRAIEARKLAQLARKKRI